MEPNNREAGIFLQGIQVDAYLGEIRLFAGNFPPVGWAFCDGQQLKITQNNALYYLIGTTYGGDGINNFNLPDLRGRVPVHQGGNRVVGEIAGSEQVTLSPSQMAAHSHGVVTSATGGSDSPAGNSWGPASANVYANPSTQPIVMSPSGISNSGGTSPHDNMIPFLAVSYIIALEGMYPSPE
jgi:microcystin-dependent protein